MNRTDKTETAKHIHSLISKQVQRMRILQQKKAHYGINCPPEIEMEILDILENVRFLEQQRDSHLSIQMMLDDIDNTIEVILPSALTLIENSKKAIDLLIESHKQHNIPFPNDLEVVLQRCDEIVLELSQGLQRMQEYADSSGNINR